MLASCHVTIEKQARTCQRLPRQNRRGSAQESAVDARARMLTFAARLPPRQAAKQCSSRVKQTCFEADGGRSRANFPSLAPRRGTLSYDELRRAAHARSLRSTCILSRGGRTEPRRGRQGNTTRELQWLSLDHVSSTRLCHGVVAQSHAHFEYFSSTCLAMWCTLSAKSESTRRRKGTSSGYTCTRCSRRATSQSTVTAGKRVLIFSTRLKCLQLLVCGERVRWTLAEMGNPQ